MAGVALTRTINIVKAQNPIKVFLPGIMKLNRAILPKTVAA
jgi:hypothetical protein